MKRVHHIIRILTVFFFLLQLSARSQDDENNIIYQAKDYIFPYNLSKPDKQVKLPTILIEISGIDFMEGERLASIQDEKGNIYILDFQSGEIEKKIDFGGDGDYEGIALVGTTAWVLKSKGDLYRVKNFIGNESEIDVKRFETELSKKNDAEGLAYDPANNRLLIATKGNPYIDGKDGAHKKSVFWFDLEEKELMEDPVFLIDLDQIKQFRKYNTMTKLGIDLLSLFDEHKGDVTFQPSGIAVHPITGNLYIIGAVGDLLLVLNKEGIPLAMVDLDDKLFKQPEGMCFDPEGVLYISNEGGESKATVLKFNVKQ